MSSVCLRGAARTARALTFVLFAAPALGATHQVPSGGDLQAALNAAQPGDVIELQAGATYTGNFRLPVKNGAEFIVIRTGGASSSLPAPGSRIDRAHAPFLAKIRSGNMSPALSTAAGAHHWRVELIEFQANAAGAGTIIALGSGTQTGMAEMPRDLVLDRVYVHGDPLFGQQRGVALNSGSTQIVNGYFEDFKAIGLDSQAICGWNGSGPYLIENNYTEAAGENVMFGGGDPAVWNLVPSDITVRRNVFTKPRAWRSGPWTVKNAFELKNARRVLIEGNIFEHVWAGAQSGHAVLFTVRNQDGRAPWSVVEDVTFRYNLIRHAGAGLNLLGFDDNHPSAQLRRIQITHNLLYDIDGARWGGPGDFIQVGMAPSDVVVAHNTVFHSGMALRVYGGRTPTGRIDIERAVFRDNAMRHNEYGVKGDGVGSGHATLAVFLPGAVFTGNVLAGGPASQYPPGNHFPAVEEFEAQFVDPGGGNYTLVDGSALRTAASDGSAVGVDLTALQRALDGAAGAQTAPEASAGDRPWLDFPRGRRPGGRRY